MPGFSGVLLRDSLINSLGVYPQDTGASSYIPRNQIRQSIGFFPFLDSQCKTCPPLLYKRFNYMFQKKHIAVLNCPKSFPEPAGRDSGGGAGGQHCSPHPGCHPLSHLLLSILCPLSTMSELTADIYFAYLISSVGVAFYSQLSPTKLARCFSPCTASCLSLTPGLNVHRTRG